MSGDYYCGATVSRRARAGKHGTYWSTCRRRVWAYGARCWQHRVHVSIVQDTRTHA